MENPEFLRRALEITEAELAEARDSKREMHMGWLADMDRWAAREAWLMGIIEKHGIDLDKED